MTLSTKPAAIARGTWRAEIKSRKRIDNALEGFRNNEKLLSGLVHGLPSDVSFTPKYFMPADATAPSEFRQYTDYTPFVKDFVGWLNVADSLPDPSAYAGTNFQSITDGVAKTHPVAVVLVRRVVVPQLCD